MNFRVFPMWTEAFDSAQVQELADHRPKELQCLWPLVPPVARVDHSVHQRSLHGGAAGLQVVHQFKGCLPVLGRISMAFYGCHVVNPIP